MSSTKKRRRYLQVMNDEFFKEVGYIKIESKINKSKI